MKKPRTKVAAAIRDVDVVDLLAYDADLADAARRAALAFGKIAQILQAQSRRGKTRTLVEMLRSGRSLGPGECAVLADLISGELCRPGNRPTKKASARKREREALERCRELMAQFKAERRSRGARRVISQQVASEFPEITEERIATMWKNAKGVDGDASKAMSRARFERLAASDPAAARAFMAKVRKGNARLVD